jgi:hypothetical protein
VGYVRDGGSGGTDCDRPVLWLCDHCKSTRQGRCNSHRSRRCPRCAGRYQKDVHRLVAEGLHGHNTNGWVTGMLTLTAPGRDPHNRLDFVTGRGRAEEYICGCESSLGDPGLWNAEASYRWHRLRTSIRRRYPDFEYVRAVEVQDRGLIHYHLAAANPGSLDLQWIRDEAVRCGFGCSTQWEAVANPHYLAKYVTKSLEADGLLWTEINTETGELVQVDDPRLRTMSRSMSWGITLKMLRERRRLEARRRAADLQAYALAAAEKPSDVGPGPALPAPDP